MVEVAISMEIGVKTYELPYNSSLYLPEPC